MGVILQCVCEGGARNSVPALYQEGTPAQFIPLISLLTLGMVAVWWEESVTEDPAEGGPCHLGMSEGFFPFSIGLNPGPYTF